MNWENIRSDHWPFLIQSIILRFLFVNVWIFMYFFYFFNIFFEKKAFLGFSAGNIVPKILSNSYKNKYFLNNNFKY